VLSGALPVSTQATTVEELQSTRRLQISSELRPAHNIVPGQRVELIIEIATDRWFSGGTRLEIPEVAGLVILQTNHFASNSSETRAGKSWVVQRWSLDVYAQRPGNFSIPAVKARVSVSDEGVASTVGELHSPALQFRASVPAALARAQQWVAAPMFTLDQSFDRELDNLQVGDAFQRQITFEASDVMAMMLPTFEVNEMAGLRAYPEPPTLSNTSNRGQTLARRVERVTYIAEEPGQYQIPARDYFWWDTRTGELQMRFLAAVTVNVGQGTAPTTAANTETLIDVNPVRWLLTGLALLSLGGLGWLAIPFAQIAGTIIRLWRRMAKLFQPALPEALNPDSSAGE